MHLRCPAASQVEAMNEQAFEAARNGNEETMTLALVNGANANCTDSVSSQYNDSPPSAPKNSDIRFF